MKNELNDLAAALNPQLNPGPLVSKSFGKKGVRIQMPESSLEERVQRLESSVQQLQAAMRSPTASKDWRRTIGAFTDDAGMQEIFKEAMKIREQDRKRTRAKRPLKRKPRQ